MDLEIKGFIESSFLDWDGKIVSTLYVAGCNFRCPFCHNSGLIEKPHEYETISLDKIEKFLLEHKDFLDGICLTGGEPCLHKNKGLFEFLKHIKSLGFLIKLDSNGLDPDCLQKAIDEKLVDYIAMDIKAPKDKYQILAGVNKSYIKNIESSTEIIKKLAPDYEFRTTVVPGLLGKEDILSIAKWLSGSKRYILQQFTVPGELMDKNLAKSKPYPKEFFNDLKSVVKDYFTFCEIRGF